MPLHHSSDYILRGYLPANYFTDEKVYGRRTPTLNKSKYPNKIDIFAGSSRYFAIITTRTNFISDIMSWMATHFYIIVTCHDVSFSNRFSTGPDDGERFTGNIKLEIYSHEYRSYAMIVFKPSRLKDEDPVHLSRIALREHTSKSDPKVLLICPNGFSLNSIQSYLSRSRNVVAANLTDVIKSELSSLKNVPQSPYRQMRRIHSNRFTISPRNNANHEHSNQSFTSGDDQYYTISTNSSRNAASSGSNQNGHIWSDPAELPNSSNQRNQIVETAALQLVNHRSSLPANRSSSHNFMFRHRNSSSSLGSVLPLYEPQAPVDHTSDNEDALQSVPYSTSGNRSETHSQSQNQSENENEFINMASSNHQDTLPNGSEPQTRITWQIDNTSSATNSIRTNKYGNSVSAGASYESPAFIHSQMTRQTNFTNATLSPSVFLAPPTSTPPAYDEVVSDSNRRATFESRLASLSAPTSRNGDFTSATHSATQSNRNSNIESQALATANVEDIMSLVIANAGTNTQRRGRTRLDLEPSFRIENTRNHDPSYDFDHNYRSDFNCIHSRTPSQDCDILQTQNSTQSRTNSRIRDRYENLDRNPDLIENQTRSQSHGRYNSHHIPQLNDENTNKSTPSKLARPKKKWYSISRPVSRNSNQNDHVIGNYSEPQTPFSFSANNSSPQLPHEPAPALASVVGAGAGIVAVVEAESKSSNNLHLGDSQRLNCRGEGLNGIKVGETKITTKHKQASESCDRSYLFEHCKGKQCDLTNISEFSRGGRNGRDDGDKSSEKRKEKWWQFSRKQTAATVTFDDDDEYIYNDRDKSLSKQIKKIFNLNSPWGKMSGSNRSTPASSCLVTPSHSRRASISPISEIPESGRGSSRDHGRSHARNSNSYLSSNTNSNINSNINSSHNPAPRRQSNGSNRLGLPIARATTASTNNSHIRNLGSSV